LKSAFQKAKMHRNATVFSLLLVKTNGFLGIFATFATQLIP